MTRTLPLVRDGSWLRNYALVMAGLTLALMAVGSTTRVMNAGLACPDWPLCYGEVVPLTQMNWQVFWEWFHRVIASGVGLLTIGFAVCSWWYRQSLPRWVPWSGVLAVAVVVWQGILGGLTVTELLRFDIVTAHLATGMAFWALWLAIGLGMQPIAAFGGAERLALVGAVSTALVYGQSVLGALVASQWALHQCLANSALCQVMHNHLWGVVPAAVGASLLPIWVWRTPDAPAIVHRLAQTIGVLIPGQILVGVATYQLQLSVPVVTVLHQTGAALLFGACWAVAVLAIRGRKA
ncbi:MAG: COX15/CtaA family protein [Pseudanabaenaceae cyanobacterium SKYGB_i_bin29]|nr:COX15/CtaA family protein [Pseudanabaenaceae cyanobacterium SKYG29]MDW8422214.1 COX15/CtaA family protein [Pseudanabaenaceae cyanobacterium SKYGB_i_bin29]